MIRNGPRTAGAARPWYRIEAAADRDTAEVFLYDEIGRNFWGEGIAAEDFIREINALSVKTIHVRINSKGGSVFEGLSIQNALERHAAHVVTHVDGLAASIASIIAMGGNEVRIADNAFLMIHNPHTIVIGGSAEMRQMAETLDKVAGSLIGVYAKKTGKSEEQIREWMDAETWFNAKDAKEHGFVDEISNASTAAATFEFDLAAYKNIPQELAARLRTPEPVADRSADIQIAALIQQGLSIAVPA